MQTTSLLLLWVMGRIKRLQRGYAVSYCKKVKYSTALACTERSIPISYTLFTRHSAQPTKHQRQSSTVCRGMISSAYFPPMPVLFSKHNDPHLYFLVERNRPAFLVLVELSIKISQRFNSVTSSFLMVTLWVGLLSN